MTNSLYPRYLESALSQSPSVDMDTDTIKVMLVKTAQAYSAAHQYVSDLTAGNIVARSAALASKTVTSGVFDAADLTFTTPATGSTCNLVVYKDSGADATSALIAFIDTGTGLPATTTGANVVVTWDSGASKIFAI